MIADNVRPHFGRARKRLQRLGIQLLVEQTLAVEVINKRQSVIERLVLWVEHTRSLVVEYRRLKVTDDEERFATVDV